MRLVYVVRKNKFIHVGKIHPFPLLFCEFSHIEVFDVIEKKYVKKCSVRIKQNLKMIKIIFVYCCLIPSAVNGLDVKIG